ncbi:hypothetical protein Tco_0978123 [Tanacetum coccineum]|uniref:Secreted protein n=1 Tax=Tanacetum coccineum TaxID=301880 RepID=A0ABQ5EM11_9ASTR
MSHNVVLCLSCPHLHTYASNAATSDANLAQAFTSQCHVTQGHPDWNRETNSDSTSYYVKMALCASSR